MRGDTTSKRWVVLDAGALIAGTETLYALGGVTDSETKTNISQPSANEEVIFYITPDVASEIRDAQARARLQLLDRLGCLVQRAPSREALAAVIQASKNAGDYSVLSTTDLRVLALTWMLEIERNGGKFLKEVEKASVLGEIRRARGVGFDDVERWEKEENERREREDKEKDGWTTVAKNKPVPPKKSTRRKRRGKKRNGADADKLGEYRSGPSFDEQKVHENLVSPASVSMTTDGAIIGDGGNNSLVDAETDKKRDPYERSTPVYAAVAQLSEMASEQGLAEQGAQESEVYPFGKRQGKFQVGVDYEAQVSGDDGDGWINEENLEEHLARDGGEEELTPEDWVRVACVTTDFAMQNTMLQIGLKLLSVDGRRTIRQIRKFALRCQSCSSVTRELHRKFCEKCGNATLHRVAFKVDKKGIARVFLNPKKKPILRGTKYPIPLPKGGRHNTDLILCEDQIDPIKQRRLEKQRERQNIDVLDPSSFYNAGARFNPHNRVAVVGYGKRNPNQVRPVRKSKR